MMEVRRRNLIIFIVIPSLVLLEHYIVVHRSNALFNIYKQNVKGKLRRTWKAYSRNKTAEIYERAKKRYGVFPKMFTSKRDRFYARQFMVDGKLIHLPYETFDEKAYDDKKGVAFGDKRSEESLDISKIELNELKNKISNIKMPLKTKKDLAEALDVTARTIRNWKALENPVKTEKEDGNT